MAKLQCSLGTLCNGLFLSKSLTPGVDRGLSTDVVRKKVRLITFREGSLVFRQINVFASKTGLAEYFLTLINGFLVIDGLHHPQLGFGGASFANAAVG